MTNELARRRRHAARHRCETSTATSPSTPTARTTSTPAARSPPASATTRPSSTGCPIVRSSPSPASATRSRCAASNQANGSSTSAPGRASTRSSPPAKSARPARVVGIDMTPEMLDQVASDRRAARVRPRRVPRGPRRSAAGRGRVGRRRHLQRRHQPLRRQAGRVRRDLPRAAPGRRAAVRRHRQRPAGPARSDARHRPVDRLNCRWAAPCGLAEDARRRRASIDVTIGPPVDTFGGAIGEDKARAYEVYGYAFMARRP